MTAPSLSSSPHWSYLATAAVLTDFAADRLAPLSGGPPDLAKVGAMLMEHGEPIQIGPAKGRWTLSRRSRSAALAELQRSGELQRATAVNRNERPDNPTQRALDALLAGATPAGFSKQSLPDLLGLESAIELASASVKVPQAARDELAATIERLCLLDPLQRLIEHGFAGRREELGKLRAYVDELGSKSFGEFLSRKLDNVLDVFRYRPLLVIWGPGGSGKSTLLAKFVIDHAGAQQTRPTPFVYLDFDRGQLDPEKPDTLLSEALRQIRAQFPRLAKRATQLSADASTRISTEDGRGVSRSAHFEQSAQLRDGFAKLIAEIGEASKAKVLFFVDTFEVVQRRGPTAVFNVLKLAAQLVQATPQLRPVIVGRAAIKDADFQIYGDSVPRWRSLPLEGFDPEAGRAYLQGRLTKLGKTKVPVQALDRVVALVRGNPLSLRLAATVFVSSGIEALETAASVAAFDAAFTQERFQGILHKRIVESLAPEAKTIADPGLIVRRLTPEVLQHVLAKPCGLALQTRADAEKLLAKLQPEASLFEVVAKDTLRHRPDVRLLMLPLLREKLKETATEIDKAAVRFWKDKMSPEARAEHLYHLLWLGAEREELEAAWKLGPASKALMDDALDEFNALNCSATTRLWLYEKLEREISTELEEEADLDQWERHTERRARSLLASGSAAEALAALRARPERKPASVLWLLEVESLKLLARDDEALELVDRALNAVALARAPAHVAKLLLQQATLYERTGKLQEASESCVQAGRIVASLDDELLLLEAKVTEARLARHRGGPDAQLLQRELADMVSRPSMARILSERPTLLREAAAEVGELRPELLVKLYELQNAQRSDRRGSATALMATGVAHLQRGEAEEAARALEEALQIAAEVKDDDLQIRAHMQLANALGDRNRLEDAAAHLMEAMTIAHRAGSIKHLVQILSNLGALESARGNHDGALKLQQQALETARSAADENGEGVALSNLAVTHSVLGDWQKSLDLLENAASIAHRYGDDHAERQALGNMATTLWKLGRAEDALSLYRESLRRARSAGDRRSEALTLSNLGAALAEQQNWQEAERNLLEAASIQEHLDDSIGLFTTSGALGTVLIAGNRAAEALDLFERRVHLASRVGDSAMHARAVEQLGLVQALLKNEGAPPSAEAQSLALPFRGQTSDGRFAEAKSALDYTRLYSDALVKQSIL